MGTHSPANIDESLFDAVRDVLMELIRDCGLPPKVIEQDASLIEDLGLDSLAMVDLTLLLEERFSIVEFPMQRWANEEGRREEPRYTVGSLVRACADLVIDVPAPGRDHRAG